MNRTFNSFVLLVDASWGFSSFEFVLNQKPSTGSYYYMFDYKQEKNFLKSLTGSYIYGQIFI